MKIVSFLFVLLTATTGISAQTIKTRYEWAIIGAGPAGITALAVLLELKVDPTTIIWFDPEFNVGRLGKYYRNVPGNLQTWRLVTYIEGCSLFTEFPSPTREKLFTYDQQAFQPLHIMVDPLIDMTQYFRTKISSIEGEISRLDRLKDGWNISYNDTFLCARKVILATGSHPKNLAYPLSTISLDEALDKDTLAPQINTDDCIAVFGSMHSAMLVLKNVSELGVKKIINFYSSPHFYGVPGTAGLEGVTAEWARNMVDNNPPANLLRVPHTPENREQFLPLCNKAIYAIGYERNPVIVNGNSDLHFNVETGSIDCHIYGIGIAFCPFQIDENGKRIDLNGFNTYLAYAKKLIPHWILE